METHRNFNVQTLAFDIGGYDARGADQRAAAAVVDAVEKHFGFENDMSLDSTFTSQP